MPGDEIEIIEGMVFLSSQKLDEPYVGVENNVRTAKRPYSTIVPEERYFVLGDNRDNSSDSRSRGFVLGENIRAKASHIWFSSNENGLQLEFASNSNLLK